MTYLFLKTRIKEFILFFGVLLFFPFVVSANGYQTGLVPCGGPGDPCTLCDFFVMFDRIIDFLLVPTIYNNYFPLVPAIGALMLAIGGFMYIFAYSGMGEMTEKGGPKLVGQAKKVFTSVVIGFIIIYGAWLLVGLFFQAIGTSEWTGLREGWWEIECDSESVTPPSSTPPDFIPRNEAACRQVPGCFWVEGIYEDKCVCSKYTDNCADCQTNKECCDSLGSKCKWESDPQGSFTCKNRR